MGRPLSVVMCGETVVCCDGKLLFVATGKPLSAAIVNNHNRELKSFVPTGNPLFVPTGNPLFVAMGNPLFVAMGNPLFVAMGNPLFVAMGNPLFVAMGNPFFPH